LRYVEKAPVLTFLKIKRPRAGSAWVLPLTGALLAGWYLLVDNVLGDGTIVGAAPTLVLFTILSPATLVEEIYFRGFLLNKFWQVTSFWRANLTSSLLFALFHFPGWYALGNFSTPLVIVVDTLGLLKFGMVFGWPMKKTGSL
jgi:membrane protease YdiL (CAAX protease family)